MPAPTNRVRRPSLSCEEESASERDDFPRAALPLRGALELAEAFRPLESEVGWVGGRGRGGGWGVERDRGLDGGLVDAIVSELCQTSDRHVGVLLRNFFVLCVGMYGFVVA